MISKPTPIEPIKELMELFVRLLVCSFYFFLKKSVRVEKLILKQTFFFLSQKIECCINLTIKNSYLS